MRGLKRHHDRRGGPPTPGFQSTLPHGERPVAVGSSLTGSRFQSTLPHGERHPHPHRIGSCRAFQSTLPHGERLPRAASTMPALRFQSTLPHGERPANLKLRRAKGDVSIHAPARGATRMGGSPIQSAGGFNPRSRNGERRRSRMSDIAQKGFNPRSRTGSDNCRTPTT